MGVGVVGLNVAHDTL